MYLCFMLYLFSLSFVPFSPSPYSLFFCFFLSLRFLSFLSSCFPPPPLLSPFFSLTCSPFLLPLFPIYFPLVFLFYDAFLYKRIPIDKSSYKIFFYENEKVLKYDNVLDLLHNSVEFRNLWIKSIAESGMTKKYKKEKRQRL